MEAALLEGLVACLPSPLILTGVAVAAFSSIRIVNQWERGLKFTLGKFSGTVEPGIHVVIPFIQYIKTVDTRILTIDIPKQDVMTKDNVPLGINGVVFFKVEDPVNAVLRIQDYRQAVSQYAQTALRDVVGSKEMDAVLSNRDDVAKEIKTIVDKETAEWGIDITNLKIQDIELPTDMKRIMARQAEAEREKRAKIIESEGELIASEKVAQAAQLLAKTPGGLHLKTLLTISNVASFDGNSIVFVAPVEMLEALKGFAGLSGSKKKE